MGSLKDVSDMSVLVALSPSTSLSLSLFLPLFTCCQHAVVIGYHKIQSPTESNHEPQCPTIPQQAIQVSFSISILLFIHMSVYANQSSGTTMI